MVVATIEEQLAQRGCEIVGRSTKDEHWEKYRKQLEDCDLVVVNGEGSLHSNNRKELLEIAVDYPSVLINFSLDKYTDFPKYAASKFKLVAARESLSAHEWKKFTGEQPIVVPDLSLMQDVPLEGAIEDVGLFDSVVQQGWKQGWQSPFDHHYENGNFVLSAQRYRRWVTGRFHGICLGLILDKALSTYPSNTHKNQGIMFDAGLFDRFYSTREEALENIPLEPKKGQYDYVVLARSAIPKLFDRITSL